MDYIPPPPEDWIAIPLQPGAEPNAYGGPGSFLFSDRSDAGTTVDFPGEGIKRDGKPIIIISKVPERW